MTDKEWNNYILCGAVTEYPKEDQIDYESDSSEPLKSKRGPPKARQHVPLVTHYTIEHSDFQNGKLEKETVDLLITDIPYNVSKVFFEKRKILIFYF